MHKQQKKTWIVKCYKIYRFAIITGAHDIQTQEQGNPTLIEIDEIIEVK